MPYDPGDAACGNVYSPDVTSVNKVQVRPAERERRSLKIGSARHGIVARFIRRPQLSA
jgi:hypothetical protein